MKLRFFCIAAATLVFPLFACSDDGSGPGGVAGAPGVAGSGSGAQPSTAGAAPAGTAGQASVGGGGQGSAGSPAAGRGGSGGAVVGGTGGSVSPGGSGGSSTSGGSAGSVVGGGSGGSSTSGGSGGSVVGGGSGGTAAGGSPAGGGSAVPATFATLRAVLMEPGPASCSGGICHDASDNHFRVVEEGVPLTDDQLYTMVTTYMTEDCGPAINKANPPESALVKLLKGACGDTIRMPYGKCNEDGDEGCVPPATINAIEQWIAAGAAR